MWERSTQNSLHVGAARTRKHAEVSDSLTVWLGQDSLCFYNVNLQILKVKVVFLCESYPGWCVCVWWTSCSEKSSLQPPLPDDHKIYTNAFSRAFLSAATSIHLKGVKMACSSEEQTPAWLRAERRLPAGLWSKDNLLSRVWSYLKKNKCLTGVGFGTSWRTAAPAGFSDILHLQKGDVSGQTA